MRNRIITSIFSLFTVVFSAMSQVSFDFSTAQRGPIIGPLHYGIFYEEINHAGDGVLYAELIRNGSIEENSHRRRDSKNAPSETHLCVLADAPMCVGRCTYVCGPMHLCV